MRQMRQTLADKVLAAINNANPEDLSNGEIAMRLGLNEPSVRRITRQLATSGEIDIYAEGGGRIPTLYRGVAGVLPGAPSFDSGFGESL